MIRKIEAIITPDFGRMAENDSQDTDRYGHLETQIADMRNTISQQGQVIANLQQKQTLTQNC